MKNTTALVLALAACAVCTGCSSWIDRSESFGIVSGERELLTLGAGDAVGAQIYINDRVIAARESHSPVLAQMEESQDISSLVAN